MSTECGRRRLATVLLLATGIGVGPASAWTVDGHAMVARWAVEVLPPSVPAFFRQGGEVVAHGAIDPDLFKLRDAPALSDRERPEHYLDLEYLAGVAPRPRRYEYLRQLRDLELDAARVGLLPHAVTEGVERLAVAFAEYRRFPDDPVIRAKTLYLAGHLAHYAADLCQPLHTTIHFDGRVGADGESPRSGIHHRVDQLFLRTAVDPRATVDGIEPHVVSPLFEAVLAELAAGHRLVDRVYALEPELSWAPGEPPPAAVRGFSQERFRASVGWVSSLFLTAWESSRRIELPFWAVDARRGSTEPSVQEPR